jgi:hypothetical protein
VKDFFWSQVPGIIGELTALFLEGYIIMQSVHDDLDGKKTLANHKQQKQKEAI